MEYSENLIELMDNDSTRKEIHITFPDDEEISEINNERIYQESLNIEDNLQDEEKLKLGKCNSASITIQVADLEEDIKEKRMNVDATFINENTALTEQNIPFGKYIVKKVERTADRRWKIITANDYMTLFDIDISEWFNTQLYPAEETKRSVIEILDLLCDYVGVVYDKEFVFINGDILVPKNIEPSELVGRDLLEQICEINACFGHFDENGMLRFIQLSQEEFDYDITTYKSVDYEDYEINKIAAVKICMEDGGLGASTDTGIEKNIYTISANSLLYSFTSEELIVIATKILNVIKNIIYTPNDTEIKGGTYIELGKKYQVNVGNKNIYGYVIKRSITGIQGMFSVLQSTGNEDTYSNDLSTEIEVLQGKSAVLKKDIDGLTIQFQDFRSDASARLELNSDELSVVLNAIYNKNSNLISGSETFVGFKVLRKLSDENSSELVDQNGDKLAL